MVKGTPAQPLRFGTNCYQVGLPGLGIWVFQVMAQVISIHVPVSSVRGEGIITLRVSFLHIQVGILLTAPKKLVPRVLLSNDL